MFVHRWESMGGFGNHSGRVNRTVVVGEVGRIAVQRDFSFRCLTCEGGENGNEKWPELYEIIDEYAIINDDDE